MVRFVISSIPDMDQGNHCLKMLDVNKTEELQKILNTRNHSAATQEDLHEATISACMTTLQLIQQIMNDLYGIQHLNGQTKSQIAAKARAEAAEKAYNDLSTTTSLSHAEILKQIGVKKRTWYDWISKGHITIR